MAKDRFEESLARLEQIVKGMESGEMTLDESIKAFEQGIRLIRFCTEKLDEAQCRVDLLLKEGETLDVRPFPGDDHGSA